MKDVPPYVVHVENLKPRRHPESATITDDPFQLDRHRILAASAFRRLEYKTQVFVNHEGDHYRTRMTHTLEVAQLARWLARRLAANADLAEAVALAHDLGHPPFGHAGELALADAMKDHGGFEHNAQALRVVEYLEHPYPEFRGLNLTFELRQCLALHATRFDRPNLDAADLPDLDDLLDDAHLPLLEGQIAALADRLAYDLHDLEDAILAGLINEPDLADIDLWQDAARPVRRQHPAAPLAAIRRSILDRLLKSLLEAALTETQSRLDATQPKTPHDLRSAESPPVALPPDLDARLIDLERFLARRVYHHSRLIRMDTKAKRFISRIFDAYVDQPRLMPPRYADRIPELPLHRVVCDYLAGMTDRFCLDEYKRLFEPFETV